MKHLIRILGPLSLLALLTACPTISSTPTGHPVVIPMDDVYTNRQTGIIFPNTVSSFVRDRLMQYDVEGNDLSVGYNSVSPVSPIIATVYIYPAPRMISIGSPEDVVDQTRRTLLNNHFKQAVDSILRFHPGSQLVSTGPTTLHQGGRDYTGHLAIFSFTEKFNATQEEAISMLYLFQRGEWLVKYRFSLPRPAAKELQPDVDDFLKSLAWPAEESRR